MTDKSKYESFFDEMDVFETTPKNNSDSPHKIKKADFNMPIPKTKTKNINQNNKNNSHTTESGFKLDDQMQVDYYGSLEQLDQEQDDEYEYQIVDIKDLKNFIQTEDMGPNLSPEEEIAALEKEFEISPDDYNVLFKLIYLYRMNKEKEKLKNMRNHTISMYPISDDMWKEWIDDEISEINSNDFEAKYNIIKIFKRAFEDFYCKIYFLLFRFKNL